MTKVFLKMSMQGQTVLVKLKIPTKMYMEGYVTDFFFFRVICTYYFTAAYQSYLKFALLASPSHSLFYHFEIT